MILYPSMLLVSKLITLSLSKSVKLLYSFTNKLTVCSADITLRQMASQLSGLPREAPCGNQTQGLNICPLTNEQVLSNLSFQSLIHPPWTIPSYRYNKIQFYNFRYLSYFSYLAYALLGRLLIAYYNPHITFEKYVQQNILETLQLANTGFVITDG